MNEPKAQSLDVRVEWLVNEMHTRLKDAYAKPIGFCLFVYETDKPLEAPAYFSNIRPDQAAAVLRATAAALDRVDQSVVPISKVGHG